MCEALYELFEDEIKEQVELRSEEKAKAMAEAKVKELIAKKLVKGKTVEQIADELEETVEVIQQLMETLN